MSYGNYSNYEEVATKFKIKMKEENFVKEEPINVNQSMFTFIDDNVKSRRSYVSENSICENIIAPILTIVAKENDIPLWSHVRFDVSEKDGLMGVPDFIIAPTSDIGTTFEKPIVCISEAKKENFNEGWAQILSEMIAAQIVNENQSLDIYGIVSTGKFWEFAKLNQNIFSKEIIAISATENLQKLFNFLNWIIKTAKTS
jgi:hypothetical protein